MTLQPNSDSHKGDMEGIKIILLTPEEIQRFPKHTVLMNVMGNSVIWGEDPDQDQAMLNDTNDQGLTSYGIPDQSALTKHLIVSADVPPAQIASRLMPIARRKARDILAGRIQSN